ncbi:uncharacterized protein [Pleurodeles waltl]|uniref:uncharacterized protein n=1 Tax=Pleurodeles waltl TaxID=8319 RepID=UPI00370981DA
MSRPTTLLRHRKKRYAEYMGTTTWEDVPQEHRLFNDAQLFFGSIFPFVQTKATARWLQITLWELMKTINATEDGFNAVKEEMRAVMLMQHRYVLDLMTAMEGGVCAKIGTACCTYVPANDADNGTIMEAIQTLHNLRKKMANEGGAPNEWFSGWLAWIPSWLSGLIKGLFPILLVMLLMFCTFQLVVGCCKKVSQKIGGMFTIRAARDVKEDEDHVYIQMNDCSREGGIVVESSTKGGNVTENMEREGPFFLMQELGGKHAESYVLREEYRPECSWHPSKRSVQETEKRDKGIVIHKAATRSKA